jgi:hypothetical protein
MRFVRLVNAVAVAFCLLGICGCATYADRVGQIRTAYYTNNLETARTIAKEAVDGDHKNSDVLKLEQAMLDLSAGDLKNSEKLFREVRDNFDNLDGPTPIRSTMSWLTDDTSRAYPGEDYEKILIRAFLALNNLMQDGSDAEAYSLQTIDKQEQIILSADPNKEAVATDAPEQEKQAKENPKANYPRVALAPYLRGMLRESTHINYDDAQRSYVAVVNWQPAFQAGKSDLQRVTTGHHSAPGDGVLYVFALTGRGPYKQEVTEVPSTVSLLIAGEIVSAVGKQTVPPNVAPVKVPKLIACANPVQAVGVKVGGQIVGTTETITDVTQLAIQQYEATYPQTIARAVARRVLKNGVVYGTKEVSGMSKNSLSSFALDMVGMAWEFTEAADTRCWGLLPDKIQVLRVELSAGEHKVQLQSIDCNGTPLSKPETLSVSIANGRNTYLLANYPMPNLVGKVLVSQP